MRSWKEFEESIKKLKKEKEERLEDDIIDEIADRVVKKIQEKLHPVIPYCFNCPYYFYYPRCPACAYHTYTVWNQTYYVVPTDSTHTYDTWGYGEEDDE